MDNVLIHSLLSLFLSWNIKQTTLNSGVPGKTLNCQAQQMVLNLLEYFEQEKRNGVPLIYVSAVRERVAETLTISKKTVYTYTIIKRKENNTVISSPGKTRHYQKFMTRDLPEGTRMTVRDTLYNMYEKGQHVTVGTLNEELKRRNIIYVGKTSLIATLKEVGFKFKKQDNIDRDL